VGNVKYLKIAAAIATIIGTIIAYMQYVKPPTAETLNKKVEKIVKDEHAAVTVSLDDVAYKGERKSLLAMFQAAKSIPSAYDKDIALKRVVDLALELGDFNMAVVAAKEGASAYNRDNMLAEVVRQGASTKENIGYAYAAANVMASAYNRSNALKEIVTCYEKLVREERAQSSKAR